MPAFTNVIPGFIPQETNKGIGFIIATGFDERNIKVVQDVVLTTIRRNLDATFVTCSITDKITDLISDYLKSHKIPTEKKIFIYPEGHEPKSEYQKQQERFDNLLVRDAAYFSRNGAAPIDYAQKGFIRHTGKNDPVKVFRRMNKHSPIWYTLQKYKQVIGTYELDSVIIFTDNPQGTEVRELLTSAKQYNFRLITVTSDGDFEDKTNPANEQNHRAYYGGIYKNEHLRKD